MVELVLPVSSWPNLALLEESVKAIVPDATVVVRPMNEEELLGLRNFLRGAMAGDPGPGEHAHGDAPPKFLDKLSKTRILGISSGKGGVGKSSVTVNLAIALAQSGHDVGVLDADVYGFSLPKMLGAVNDPIVLGDTVIPTLAHGVRCVSMGYFVPDEQPVIWRGPMLHKAIQQLVSEAWWDEPDFLLIDMPPGTGDVALTLSEVLPRIEMYVVTTPQAAAQRVAQRSAYAARKLKLSVRGVIENMSWFTGDDAKRYEIFGAGGGSATRARTRHRVAGTDSARHQAARGRRRRRADRRARSRQRSVARLQGARGDDREPGSGARLSTRAQAVVVLEVSHQYRSSQSNALHTT
jgi:Mrp family chromosome partitioning ATPase